MSRQSLFSRKIAQRISVSCPLILQTNRKSEKDKILKSLKGLSELIFFIIYVYVYYLSSITFYRVYIFDYLRVIRSMMRYKLKYAFRSTNINTTFINNHNGKYC